MRATGCVVLGLVLTAASVARGERLPVQTFTMADGLAYDRVKCIVRDSRGILWFCSAAGLDWFDGRRFVGHTLEEGLAFSTNDLLEAPDHTYWIATNGRGVARLNPAGERIDVWPPPRPNGTNPSHLQWYAVGDTVTTNRVNKLFRDRSGRLWAGTDNGLFQFDGREFHAVALPESSGAHLLVWAFAESADGSLWIGTSLGLVRRLPHGDMTRVRYRTASGDATVWALLVNDDGTLWIGDAMGVHRASIGTSTHGGDLDAAFVRLAPPPRIVFALYKSPRGTIWIGYSTSSMRAPPATFSINTVSRERTPTGSVRRRRDRSRS
jgi:ligand-binding sensor domain-containing protein